MNLGNSKKVISLCLLAALTTTTLGAHAVASGPGKVPEDVGNEKHSSSLNIGGSVQQRGNGQNAISGGHAEQIRGSAPAAASGSRPLSSGSVDITGDVDQEGNGQNAVGGGSIIQRDESNASERLLDRTLGFITANPRTAAAAGIAALAVLVFAVKNADGIANLMRSFQGTPKG